MGGRRAAAVALGGVLLATGALAGCGPTGAAADPPSAAPLPRATPAPADTAGNRVGVLFKDGTRLCTASVVDSPRGNLLVTAAHCVWAGDRPLDGVVFAPGYRDGDSPYGSWPVTATFVDGRWSRSADPESDVAFLAVGEEGGKRIEDLLGGNRLGTGLGFGLEVTVTGYPHEREAPVSCRVRTTAQSTTQERFDCAGYTEGTSGGPWVTGTGQVVGVIGGYQEGGDTADTSYSVAFDDRVAELYRRATA
ncbi:trypsin-like serine peptidase [Kitasatospora sp. NPDC048365]|uniref:trypsin-like serine peptidase n=1 Tax=Kitasatospora sp. NPDC048365 TaxID=3364050 RepID=UPI0037217A3F